MTSPAPGAASQEPSATVSVPLAVTRLGTGGDSSVRPLRALTMDRRERGSTLDSPSGDTGRLRRPANRTEHAWPPRRPLTRPTHAGTACGSGGEATDLDTGERLIRLRCRGNPVSPGPLRLRVFVGPSPMPTTLIGALTRGHRTHENTPPTRRLVQRLTPPSSTRSGPTWWPATATQTLIRGRSQRCCEHGSALPPTGRCAARTTLTPPRVQPRQSLRSPGGPEAATNPKNRVCVNCVSDLKHRGQTEPALNWGNLKRRPSLRPPVPG